MTAWEPVRYVGGGQEWHAPEPPPLPGSAVAVAEPIAAVAAVVPELPGRPASLPAQEAPLVEPLEAPGLEAGELPPLIVRVRKRVALFGIAGLAFGLLFLVLGLAILSAAEELMPMALGAFLLAIGVFYGYMGYRVIRRMGSLSLTPEGIVRQTTAGPTLIPWADIEKIGLTHLFGIYTMVGIRLRTYDNYLARMSPEVAEGIMRTFRFARLFSRTGSMVTKPPEWIKLWSKAEEKKMGDLGKIGDLAELLAANRNYCGYDLAFGWEERDRPAAQFVTLLDTYRRHYVPTARPA
jgi:hypothetical protein